MPVPTDLEPADLGRLGPDDDEPPLPDEATRPGRSKRPPRRRPRSRRRPTRCSTSGSRGGAGTEGAMETFRQVIRSHPGGTRVVLHVPGGRRRRAADGAADSASPTTPSCWPRSGAGSDRARSSSGWPDRSASATRAGSASGRLGPHRLDDRVPIGELGPDAGDRRRRRAASSLAISLRTALSSARDRVVDGVDQEAAAQEGAAGRRSTSPSTH